MSGSLRAVFLVSTVLLSSTTTTTTAASVPLVQTPNVQYTRDSTSATTTTTARMGNPRFDPSPLSYDPRSPDAKGSGTFFSDRQPSPVWESTSSSSPRGVKRKTRPSRDPPALRTSPTSPPSSSGSSSSSKGSAPSVDASALDARVRATAARIASSLAAASRSALNALSKSPSSSSSSPSSSKSSPPVAALPEELRLTLQRQLETLRSVAPSLDLDVLVNKFSEEIGNYPVAVTRQVESALWKGAAQARMRSVMGGKPRVDVMGSGGKKAAIAVEAVSPRSEPDLLPQDTTDAARDAGVDVAVVEIRSSWSSHLRSVGHRFKSWLQKAAPIAKVVASKMDRKVVNAAIDLTVKVLSQAVTVIMTNPLAKLLIQPVAMMVGEILKSGWQVAVGTKTPDAPVRGRVDDDDDDDGDDTIDRSKGKKKGKGWFWGATDESSDESDEELESWR